jgi:nucleoside-diphosphate-sugar epimerase
MQMTDHSDRLFLVGPGFSATALARIWPGRAQGTVRSKASRRALENSNIEPVSITDENALQAAARNAHIVVSIPPAEAGCPGLDLLADFVDQARSVTYLSTTGVYGDLSGGWAMEWSDPNPQSERAARRVNAENAWKACYPALKIARLPGIYGPGRSAFDRLRAGRARRIVKKGQVFSRIHVDDIASGLRAMIDCDVSGVFHICDDQAAPPQDVITHAAELLKVEAPPEIDFDAAELSDMARSFYSECKRVSNAKLKAATGWRPSYPDYRLGLSSILDAEA